MEILRERELRESIEKQMMEDQRSRGKLFSVHHSFSFRYIFEYPTLLTGCAYSYIEGVGKREREKRRAVAQLSSYSID